VEYLQLAKIVVTSVRFVIAHSPTNGEELAINVEQISSIRGVADADTQYQKDVNCVITMTNGKSIGVVENCREMFELARKAGETTKTIYDEPKKEDNK